MKRTIILASISVLCLLQFGWGQVPRTISYQGVLKDANGNLLDEEVNLAFSLWDVETDGTRLWSSDTYVDFEVTAGIFHVNLGSSKPFDLDFDAQYWLEIAVNGALLSPRTRLTSSPYSFHALRADTAQYALSAPAGGGAWSLAGNSGTTDGTNFLGTSDDVPLELHVNGTRALRLEPHAMSPNVIGGHIENIVAPGVYGATIGGGGTSGYVNQVTAPYAAIGGGYSNKASGGNAAIGGGNHNTASGAQATVGGGQFNSARGLYSVVSGGGGPTYADSNAALGDYSVVSGGFSNTTGDSYSNVGGGWDNTANGNAATVGGGELNTASNTWATVSGGSSNTASGSESTVGGGYYNTASGNKATVGGGEGNTASNTYATVGGGWSNTASGYIATVGGGHQNIASSDYTTVSGGRYNRARGSYAVVSGGGGPSPVDSNSALGDYSAVGGGRNNKASGFAATVPGGFLNVAAGVYSFAAGYRAKAVHDGAFVWADGTDADFASTANNEFAVRATGGFRFLTSTDGSGLRLEPTAEGPNVIGGYSGNSVTGGVYGATIGGGGVSGYVNQVTANYGTVGGGYKNTASGSEATVGGGYDNTASGSSASVGGGYNNTASGSSATVAGGIFNFANNYATVGGGVNNNASYTYATVGGGNMNTASGAESTVSGGDNNTASAYASSIGGGRYNTARGSYAVVSGGGGPSPVDSNSALGDYSAVGGGHRNTASGACATVSGGSANTASGFYATVPGGYLNNAGGWMSFAAGRRAKANHGGSFVWADSSANADLATTAADQFLIRASGGVYLYTNSTSTSGQYMAAGGSGWSTVSDRNMKENFKDEDGEMVLAAIAAMPIPSWNYRS